MNAKNKDTTQAPKTRRTPTQKVGSQFQRIKTLLMMQWIITKTGQSSKRK